MNKKYERYINYIVNDIEAPYFTNMKDNYGLKDNEYELVLSKLYDQPVTIEFNGVYDTNGNQIYYEDSNGNWAKWEYDTNGDKIYSEDSTGYWVKRKYDTNGNVIYREDSNGTIIDNRYE